MGARRKGLLKMAQRPHERKASSDSQLPGRHQTVGVKKKSRKKKKKPLKIKVAAKPAGSADAEMEADIFGLALAAPSGSMAVPATSAAAASPPAEAVQQPPAFADADKNELFRRVISYNGIQSSLHPRDARRQHDELLKRQKVLRREQKYERFVTKDRKPFYTAVLPY